MRLFVAFELPPDVQARIADRTLPLRSRLPAASWVPAERLHLTLVFLGEVEEARLAELDDALQPVFGVAPRLRFRLSNAGTFPPGRPARVAWVGVEGRAAATQGEDRDFSAAPPDAALAQIESRARAALAPILDRAGEDRPYHAHVTVARPRQPWRRDAVSAFRSACEGLAGEWEGTRAVLMESRLGSEARYTVRRQYPLAEEVAA